MSKLGNSVGICFGPVLYSSETSVAKLVSLLFDDMHFICPQEQCNLTVIQHDKLPCHNNIALMCFNIVFAQTHHSCIHCDTPCFYLANFSFN